MVSNKKYKKISKKRLWDFVAAQPIITMASVAKNGSPRCTPMLFVLTKQWTMYMVTRKQTTKYKNVKETKKVSLSVWQKNDLAVQFNAIVTEVTDQHEVEKAQDMLAIKGAAVEDFWPPVIRMQAGEYVIIKLKLTQAQCIDLTYDFISQSDSPVQFIELP